MLLKYLKDKAEKPFITHVVRQYDVDINIIQGKVVQTQRGNEMVHFTVQLTGNEVMPALNYLEEAGVEVEVMTR